MANRLTLMDGELTDFQPTALQTRPGRFPVRTTSPTEQLSKTKQQYATKLSAEAGADEKIIESRKPKKEKPDEKFIK